MKKEFLEFFAGIGLARVGLENEGWTCVFANDINPKKARIYERCFGLREMVEADIETIESDRLPHVLLATASFPCQDLSEAGLSVGIHGTRSSYFWYFASLLRRMNANRPPIVLLENVRGFLTVKKGKNLLLAVRALNTMGYSCDVLLIDGKYFVPQSRPRIFVIGVQQSHLERLDRNLKKEFTEHQFRTPQIISLMERNRDFKWFNFLLPAITRTSAKLTDILDLSDDIPPEFWFNEDKVKKHLEMMPTAHRLVIEQMVKAEKAGVFTMYRRMRDGKQRAELRLDDIAGCLRSASGGSSKQFIVTVEMGKVRMRKFTIPELRRLMDIPPNFILPDVYNDAYTALGEALIPSVVQWIAENILNPLCDF